MLEQTEIEMMEMQKQNSNITNIHTRHREQQERNEPKIKPLEMLLSGQSYHCFIKDNDEKYHVLTLSFISM